MKILGLVLLVVYAGLTLFAAIVNKKERLPLRLIIGGGAILSLTYFILQFFFSYLFVICIVGLVLISLGALLVGISKKEFHLIHHLVRLLVVITICLLILL